MEELSLKKFEEAAEKVKEVTLATNLVYSEYFSNQSGNKVYLKPENMQYTGAYKVRGAYYKISTMSEDARKKGLITASAGNHAQGVAYAASKYGVPATVVMPTTTPLIKVNRTKGYGAKVVLYGNVYDEACEYAMKLAKEGKFGSIEVLYSLYVNTLRQEPTLVKIAPVDNLETFIERLRVSYKLDTQERPQEDRIMNFEPSMEEIRKELPAYYINQAIYHMALDAKASEHSARMVAMKSASDNADKLVQALTLEYNKARQNAITTEILELSAASQISE